VPRGADTDVRVVRAAVPAGSVRAADQGRFLRAVGEHPAFAHLRSDGWARLWAVARAVAFRADWESMTSRPTWAKLAQDADCSKRTVGRYLAMLEEAGLVGVVASGRSSKRSAKALHIEEGEVESEAAVYVLCTPSPLSSVDEVVTPTPKVLFGENPQRASARERADAVSLRDRSCAAAARPDVLTALRQVRPGSPVVTQRRQDAERVRFALELQRAFPTLRAISTAHVASIVRNFVVAGWTLRDVQRAVDERPDGTRWRHDGGTGVRNVGAWLTYRLMAWRAQDGTVRSSLTQCTVREATERRARQQAQRQRWQAIQDASVSMPAELRAVVDSRLVRPRMRADRKTRASAMTSSEELRAYAARLQDRYGVRETSARGA